MNEYIIGAMCGVLVFCVIILLVFAIASYTKYKNEIYKGYDLDK